MLVSTKPMHLVFKNFQDLYIFQQELEMIKEFGGLDPEYPGYTVMNKTNSGRATTCDIGQGIWPNSTNICFDYNLTIEEVNSLL